MAPTPNEARRVVLYSYLLTVVYNTVYIVPMYTITVDRDHGDAVYAQVAEQLRQLIASGALPAGTAIPSVRHLARDLGVSLNTIARAYRLLEAEGFLDIRDRAGVTVSAPARDLEVGARAELVGDLRTVLARLRQAGMGSDELLAVVREEVGKLDAGSGGVGGVG
jgi:DNA-binding transcriptional regulator YhcF (GntR family)